MQQKSIAGSCLCGSVRYEIKPPFSLFKYCHCSRCQKTTGTGHAANLFLPAGQFGLLSGESLIRHFDLPGAKRFAVNFCTQCGTRVPHQVTGTENMLVPAGTLDADPEMRPDGSIFWKSKAPWFVETPALPKFDEYGK
jgi:hypothetical protein